MDSQASVTVLKAEDGHSCTMTILIRQALDESISTSYIRAVSSETSAFDLSQTASDRWFVHGYETDREVPLQHFSLDLVLAKSSSAKPVATTVKRKMTARMAGLV